MMKSPDSPYSHAALLAHELLDVIRPACAPSGGAARLPPAERVDPGPCARRGARATVGVRHPRLDAIEELLDLPIVLREDAGSEPVLGAVGERNRLVE